MAKILMHVLSTMFLTLPRLNFVATSDAGGKVRQIAIDAVGHDDMFRPQQTNTMRSMSVNAYGNVEDFVPASEHEVASTVRTVTMSAVQPDILMRSTGYVRISNGTCEHHGYSPIASLSTCDAAAAAFGLLETAADDSSVRPNSYPTGCYYKSGAGKLYFNTLSSGIGAAASRELLCSMTASPTPALPTSPTMAPRHSEVVSMRKTIRQDETLLSVQRPMLETSTHEFVDIKMKNSVIYNLIPSWAYSLIILCVVSSFVPLAIIAYQCTVNAEFARIVNGRLESIRRLSQEFGIQRGPKAIKDELQELLPMINERDHVHQCRQIIKSRILEIFEGLVADGSVDKNTKLICASEESKNVFAKLGAGSMRQSTMDKEQAALGKFQDNFVICANRRMDDIQWNTKDLEFIPRASMSAKHRFLTIKDLHWSWFNPIVYGLVPKSHGGVNSKGALSMVEEIEAAAMHYVSNSTGWSKDVQLFFNPYPYNGFSALCIHILDMSQLGLSFEYHLHKNCPLNILKQVLQEEIQAQLQDGERSEPRPLDGDPMPSDGYPDTESDSEFSAR